MYRHSKTASNSNFHFQTAIQYSILLLHNMQKNTQDLGYTQK